MNENKVLRIKDNPALKNKAANWFYEKWGIPIEVYAESMDACLNSQDIVPQWYMILDKEEIIAGLGIIENDFHNREDLTPNICALYVDERYRCQGIAGHMLKFVCKDMKDKGIDTLYLITDHTSFYERYGWEFLCMVQVDGEPGMTRMYVHRQS